jgi:predicted DCC family thiol-disulfide oxidoreductase YuxK
MSMAALRTGALLVFDGDCGFCTTSVRWLEARFTGAFVTVPYQRVDLATLGLTERECDARVQWIGDVVSPTTSRQQGAPAVAALMRVGGRHRGGGVGTAFRALGAIATVPPVSWVAAGVYALVSRNRHRLPGGTPACRV